MPHTPTKNKLGEQERRDDHRMRYPTLNSSSSKTYRSFDSIEAMMALVSSAITIKHRLAAEADKERLKQEELERQRRERARLEREKLRQDFVLKKADEFARFEKLYRLA